MKIYLYACAMIMAVVILWYVVASAMLVMIVSIILSMILYAIRCVRKRKRKSFTRF